MTYKHIKYVVIMLIVMGLIVLSTMDVEAKKSNPFPYRVDNAHVVEKNHKITIEWYQSQRTQITVYKLNSHFVNLTYEACITVETVLFRANGLVGTIRVTDKHYKNNDQYYIYQGVNNHSYGPFIPTYR